MINIKWQLSGDKFSKDIKAILESNNNRSVKHKCFIQVIIMLPGMSLENEICRCNDAINAVIDYCNVKEDRAYWQNHY